MCSDGTIKRRLVASMLTTKKCKGRIGGTPVSGLRVQALGFGDLGVGSRHSGVGRVSETPAAPDKSVCSRNSFIWGRDGWSFQVPPRTV